MSTVDRFQNLVPERARVMEIDVVTAADGSATAEFPPAFGFIQSVRYAKAGAANYADTVDFNITVKETAQPVWVQDNITASTIRAPRAIGHVPTTGVVHATLAAAERIFLANQTIQVVLANGGDTKTGTFEAVIMPH